MKKVRYELNQETKIDICRYINMNSGNADRPADQLRCSAVISQLPENCTWKMHPEPIFRDIDKHPGQTAPDVTSALCDVCIISYRTISIVPAPIRIHPATDFIVMFSCRRTTASIMVITTDSLSIGTTFDTSPICKAM